MWSKQSEQIGDPLVVDKDVIDSASELAKIHGYPTNIWYDSSACAPMALDNSKKLLNEKISKSDTQYNIKFKDLMNIPAYAQNINVIRKLGIYFIIDISKLFILLYELELNGRDGVIFIDKDRCLLHDKNSQIDLWSEESQNMLKKSGVILSDCMDNKYLQVSNNEHIIKALTMVIDSGLTIGANFLNNKFNLELANLIYHISQISGLTTQLTISWLPKYFKALEEGTMNIRADLVNEGEQDQTVPYSPDRHNLELMGNYYSTRIKYIMYVPEDGTLKGAMRPPVNLGLDTNEQAARIKIEMRLGRSHTDDINFSPDNHIIKLWNECNDNVQLQKQTIAIGASGLESNISW